MENDLPELAKLIRYFILIMTAQAGSGHPTSCFSAVDLMTVLYFKYLRYDLDDPEQPLNDRVIFSKGHTSALLYSLIAASGKLTKEDLLQYRTFDSVLEGHPTKRFKYTEAATGSLGQGLSVGVGEAYALAKLQKSVGPDAPRIFVLLGDGEMAEGAVWEAVAWAAHQKLNNIVVVADVNGFGQSDKTMHQHKMRVIERKFKAFGWKTYVIDGHDYGAIDNALGEAIVYPDGPSIILAKTKKGKGISVWENKPGWHNKMLTETEFQTGLKELGEINFNLLGLVTKPIGMVPSTQTDLEKLDIHPDKTLVAKIEDKLTRYKPDEKVATKKAFGNAIERLGGQYPELVVLDGDVKNSLHTDQFAKKFSERFLQCYIAEQNMVGMAVGLAREGYLPIVATFTAFMSRAHDQIRMAPLSGVTLFFDGAYGGVSVGKDGPSQEGLEDLAIFRPLLNSTVLYPADAYATERLVEEMVNLEGVVYLRTTREPTPMIYSEREQFRVGGSKEFKYQIANIKYQREITVVAAGITLHEALKAAEQLKKEGVAVRVIDCYSIKPIDVATLKLAARETQAIITVEDHYAVGGLGDAVLEALADEVHPPVYKLAVTKTPRSGKPEELLAFEEIDAAAIVQKIRQITQSSGSDSATSPEV